MNEQGLKKYYLGDQEIDQNQFNTLNTLSTLSGLGISDQQLAPMLINTLMPQDQDPFTQLMNQMMGGGQQQGNMGRAGQLQDNGTGGQVDPITGQVINQFNPNGDPDFLSNLTVQTDPNAPKPKSLHMGSLGEGESNPFTMAREVLSSPLNAPSQMATGLSTLAGGGNLQDVNRELIRNAATFAPETTGFMKNLTGNILDRLPNQGGPLRSYYENVYQ